MCDRLGSRFFFFQKMQQWCSQSFAVTRFILVMVRAQTLKNINNCPINKIKSCSPSHLMVLGKPVKIRIKFFERKNHNASLDPSLIYIRKTNNSSHGSTTLVEQFFDGAQWAETQKKVYFGKTMHCLPLRLKLNTFWKSVEWRFS